jgi:hypothetical protein
MAITLLKKCNDFTVPSRDVTRGKLLNFLQCIAMDVAEGTV